MTLSDLLNQATATLHRAGIPTPRLEAELIISHVAGVRRVTLFSHPKMELPPDIEASVEQAVRRRAERVPLPYITGYREFMGLRFMVTPQTLIPRPETEVLVETALAFLQDQKRDGAMAERRWVLDIGAGSGAVAVSLAHFLPEIRVVATDISWEALQVAKENATRLAVAPRVRFVCANLLSPFRATLPSPRGGFLVIVANLPYIPSEELPYLQPEVRDHEPRVALDGGSDGLTHYRQMIPEAARLLSAEGMLAVEVGLGQSEVVGGMFREAGLQQIEVIRDLAGIGRVVTGRGRGRER